MVSFRKALLEVAMCEPRVHATNPPVVKWPRQLYAMTVEDDPQQMVSARHAAARRPGRAHAQVSPALRRRNRSSRCFDCPASTCTNSAKLTRRAARP